MPFLLAGSANDAPLAKDTTMCPNYQQIPDKDLSGNLDANTVSDAEDAKDNDYLFCHQENYVSFVPAGYKCSLKMLEKIVSRLGYNQSFEIIQEMKIRYSDNMYNNILHQFKNYSNIFLFSQESYRRQLAMYGYLIYTNSTFTHPYEDMYYIFSKKQTQDVLHCTFPRFQENRYQAIKKLVDTRAKRDKSCVVGKDALALFGVNVLLNEKPEVLSIDPQINSTDISSIEYAMCDEKQRHYIQNKEGILTYRGKSKQILPHVLKVISNQLRSINCIFNQNLIIYYRGIKFLNCLGRDEDIHTMHTIRLLSQLPFQPNFNRLITPGTNIPKYEDKSTQETTVWAGKSLEDLIRNFPEGHGLWIMRPDHVLEVTINHCFLPWVLTNEFLAYGGIAWSYQSVCYDCAYKKINAQHLEDSLKQISGRIFTRIHGLKLKVKDKNKKEAIKRNVHQKGNYISLLPSLLPRNRGLVLEVCL
tara:strand:- start:2708 stop:4126 length:1419 start_codon:yes stop_codon:yes gene_type:complete